MFHEEDIPSIFSDLQKSVYSKAFSISANLDAQGLPVSDKSDGHYSENECVYHLKGSPRMGKNSTSSFSPPACSASTPKSKSRLIKTLEKEQQSSHNCVKHLFVKSKPQKLNEVTQNSFTSGKLLQLCDAERCLTVEKVMRERIQSMQITDKLIHDHLEHLKQTSQEEENTKRMLLEQTILDIHEQDMKNRPRREEQLALEKQKNAQHVIDLMQRLKDAENEAKEKAKALLAQRQLLDKKILECQQLCLEQHKEVHALIGSCENMIPEGEKRKNVLKDLKVISSELEVFHKEVKSNDITEEDVNAFLKQIEVFKEMQNALKKDVDTINMEEPICEAQANEEANSHGVIKDDPKTNDQTDLSDCFDSESLEKYVSLKAYLKNYDDNCKNLLQDSGLTKFRFSCQKAVTTPVNAISPVNSAHLTDKYLTLHNLLSGRVVDVGGVQVSAAQHPEGIAYCKKLLAKKFVRQGDLTVSSKPNAAFSIAAVLASLWIDFPDFGQLALACFQNACPYLGPVFMPQVEGQSVEEYYKSLGYKYMDNGEVEKQGSFLKRMGGIMRLYAAVIITKVRQPGKQNPLGLSEGWRWISSLLNLEPRPDICATLLFAFLEVAGNEMFRVYGVQFKKLLAYICQIYFPKLEMITPASSGGPLLRLEQFLQKIMKNESIPPPDGHLPDNFW